MIEITLAVLWVVVIANMCLTLAIIRHLNSQNNQSVPRSSSTNENLNTLEVGVQAPDFTVQNLNGEMVSSTNYLGKDTAFLFVEPNCQPCRETIKTLDSSIGIGAKRLGIEVVIVVLSSLEKARQFTEDFKIELPVLVASDDNPIKADYMVKGTPSFCFFDKARTVQAAGFLGNNWVSLTNKWKSAR